MVSFESDYICGAHPAVLQRLSETNLDPQPGYGEDAYCRGAAEKIRLACEAPDADVFFLAGGTQTNAVVSAALLSPWQGVVSAQSGHIHAHEAGAIEQTGHKVLALPSHRGKVDAKELRALLTDFYSDENREHMVFPGLLYVSHPTEWGTLYTRAELAELSTICHENGMKLFLDGARLAYALESPESDVTLPLLAELCDAFYIGGTKCGALCGEAVVFPLRGMPPHFLNFAKKHGALLAKGRLLGVQFDALFTGGLYYEIGRQGVEMARRVVALLEEYGVEFYLKTPTNQQFALLEDGVLERLQKTVRCGFWSKPDKTRTIVRFATSWSTTEKDIEVLRKALLSSK